MTYDVRHLFGVISISLIFCIAGCTSSNQILHKQIDYHSQSDNIAHHLLEIPPDLSSLPTHSDYTLPRGSATLNAFEQNPDETDHTVLPINNQAKLVKAGTQRWLVVQSRPEKIWSEIKDFWIASGFSLTIEDPAIGIMETDWKENRAKLPQDWLNQMLSKISTRLISTGELDKYRTRIERGTDPETVDIYLTHRGMQEVYRNTGTTTAPSDSDTVASTIWEPRQSDPELEAQMLGLLMQYLGYSQKTIQATLKAPTLQQSTIRIVGTDPSQVLEILDSFDRAWRRVGLAIENAGYIITDRNRAEGTYYVRRADQDIAKEENTNIFSKLAFWRAKNNDKTATDQPEFHVQLKQEQDRIHVLLVPKNAVADTETRKQLLENLAKQLG